MANQYHPGDVIANRYHVQNTLRGGMGLVHICYDDQGQQAVALKTFQDRYLATPSARQRFIREASLWIDLPWHLNIVFAHSILKWAEKPFVILDYIAGPDHVRGASLRSWIGSRHLSIGTSLDLALHICEGMAYASSHFSSFVHRDLKPENILVPRDGFAKVTDFGLARSLWGDVIAEAVDLPEEENGALLNGPNLTRAGAALGTLAYMSPELCLGQAHTVDIRSDVYGFGCILYEMLTGQMIFSTDDHRRFLDLHVHEQPLPPRHLNEAIPPELEEVVMQCLAKNPEDRYANFDALFPVLAELHRSVTGHPHIAEGYHGDWAGVSGRLWPTEFQVSRHVTQGYGLHVLGRYEEAVEHLQKAVELDPQDATAWTNLSNSLLALGRHQEAIACCDRALALDPGLFIAWVAKGIAYTVRLNWQEALTCFERACEADPLSEKGWYNRANALIMLQRFEEALPYLERALAIQPEYVKALAQKISVLNALGHYEAALETAERALSIDPLFTLALVYKISVLKNLGRHAALARARQEFDEISNQALPFETDVQSIELMGNSLMLQQEFPQAIRAYDRILEIAPGHVMAWMHKAICLRRLGRHAESLSCYDRVVELDPDNDNGWVNRGNVLADLNRFEEAIEAYQRALDLDPGNALAWQNLGNQFAELNQPQRAVECYQKAVALDKNREVAWAKMTEGLVKLARYQDALVVVDQNLQASPRDPNLWVRRSWILNDLLHQPEAALESCDRALAINPNWVPAWVNRASSLMQLGYLETALESCDQALALDPNSVGSWINKGTILGHFGRYDEMLYHSQHGLAIDPRNPLLWQNQAVALEGLGRKEEALGSWQQCLDIDPGRLVCWTGLANLLGELGHQDGAIQAYEHAIQLDPSNAVLHLNYGVLLYQSGAVAEALTRFEQAAQLGHPKGAEYAAVLRQQIR